MAETDGEDWRIRGARLTAVAAFAAFVALAGVFFMPPIDRDESRFAQATAQMLESGDFIAIRFQETERNKKPAGIYWLQAASVSAFSAVEKREIWAYRLPSVAGAVIAALFTYFAGARLYGAQTGMLAALLLSSSPLFFTEASTAKTDAALLAMVCIAQAALIHIYARFQERRTKGWLWPLTFWAALGCGVLIKGPIAPMVAALTCLTLFIRSPQLALLRAMRPLTGILILVLIIAPWAIAIGKATEWRFFAEAIGRDMLGKLGTAQESHAGPPGYHLAFVWILFWPAVALLLPGFAKAVRTRSAWPSYFLLAWIIPSWLIFELTATKLPHYTLPLYPALAILAARAAASGEAARRVLWRRIGAASYLATGLAIALIIAGLSLWFADGAVKAIGAAAGIAIGAVAFVVAALFWSGRAHHASLAACALGAVLAWVLLAGVLPSLKPLAISPRLSAALDDAGRHPLHDAAPPAAIAGFYEPSAVFLIGTQTNMTGGSGAARHLATHPGAAAAVDSRLEKEFHESLNDAGIHVEALAVVDGLNYSNGRTISLTIYIARQ